MGENHVFSVISKVSFLLKIEGADKGTYMYIVKCSNIRMIIKFTIMDSWKLKLRPTKLAIRFYELPDHNCHAHEKMALSWISY